MTPESRNQERNTHRGEQEPHDRWRNPSPLLSWCQATAQSALSLVRHPVHHFPPQGCRDKGLQTRGQNNTKAFSPVLEPRSQKSRCRRWSPLEVLRRLSQLLEAPGISRSAEASPQALPPSSRHLSICVFSPFLPLQGHLWDFPGGPVPKSLQSQCRGSRFNPWSGN